MGGLVDLAFSDLLGIDTESEDDETKEEVKDSKASDGEQVKFSPRIEALIKSAFRDGIITNKEKEVIVRRAVAEGEDRDEFEMLLDSRIAEEGIKEE